MIYALFQNNIPLSVLIGKRWTGCGDSKEEKPSNRRAGEEE
jgi:hypothetical protein